MVHVRKSTIFTVSAIQIPVVNDTKIDSVSNEDVVNTVNYSEINDESAVNTQENSIKNNERMKLNANSNCEGQRHLLVNPFKIEMDSCTDSQNTRKLINDSRNEICQAQQKHNVRSKSKSSSKLKVSDKQQSIKDYIDKFNRIATKGDCHTQTKLEPASKTESTTDQKSELEVVFEKINRNRLNDLKNKYSPKSPKSTPKKSKFQHSTQNKSSKKNTPSTIKSISEIMRCNSKLSSVKKKEPNRVKKMIRELENPAEKKSKTAKGTEI